MGDPTDNTTTQIRAHIAAAIARLEPFSRGTGPVDQDALMGAFTVAEHELEQVMGLLERLRGAP